MYPTTFFPAARPSATDNGTQGYPPENMTIEEGPFMAQWNSAPRSTAYSASGLNAEMPQYQPLLLGPSHDPFLHPSAVGNSSMVQDDYPLHHASSSNQSAQTYHGVDGGFFELSMGNGGGLHKRKSPSGPAAYERGNTSRYYDAGSSSDHPIQANCCLEKQNTDSRNSPADFVACYRGNMGSEGAQRNVRSRSAFDLESNQARTHLSYNTSHHSFAVQSPEHLSTADLLGQSTTTSPVEWGYSYPSSASNGRNMVSDSKFFSHETNHYSTLNPITSVDIGEYFNDFSSNRNPVPQALHGTSSQFSRGVRSGYTHRPMPPIRASSMNLPVGSTDTSDEGLVTENYASRNPRPLSALGIRTGDRNGRSRIFSDRCRSISDQVAFRDQPTPEGLIIMDRSAVYGSRSFFDHHRDMRLDIDNMSYQELLDLGERIGTVNTGLSEELLTKSLTESIYCSADQLQDGKCVICLEEYKNMDEVGTLKSCGHDFHAGCIRQWLSLKNSCPICKATALDDKMKLK